MHEAATVERAIRGVVSLWPSDRARGRLELGVRDATRAEPVSVAFYATAILQDLGLDEVDFDVVVDASRCVLCDATVVPSPAHPVCDACGAPLPLLGGPAVTCRDTTEASEPTKGPA